MKPSVLRRNYPSSLKWSFCSIQIEIVRNHGEPKGRVQNLICHHLTAVMPVIQFACGFAAAARVSSVGVTSMPSAFAVLRLLRARRGYEQTSSNFDGSSFVIFALKRIIQYLIDSLRGIARIAVIADINRDRNAAMNETFVAPLPKSDVSLLSDDVTFPT
jgi:hypothetical protein